MDSPGVTLQDLLGPVAYAEWFGDESSRTSTASEDETVRGGASGSSVETTRGGADTAASSSLGDDVDELLKLTSQQFEKQELTKQERDARFAIPKTDEVCAKMQFPKKLNKTLAIVFECGMLGLLTEMRTQRKEIPYFHCFS